MAYSSNGSYLDIHDGSYFGDTKASDTIRMATCLDASCGTPYTLCDVPKEKKINCDLGCGAPLINNGCIYCGREY